MPLGGLWHGARWSFVLWGGLHGLYLMINHAWRATFGPMGNGLLDKWVCRIVTFMAVLITWVPFRVVGAEQITRFYKAMFDLEGVSLDLGGFAPDKFYIIVGCLLLVWLVPNVPTVMRHYRPNTGPRLTWDGWKPLGGWVWHPEPFWAIITALLSIACLMQMSRAGEFIYYRF